jgi:hypothetical protein
MEKSFTYIVDKLQEKLGRTDLSDFVENLINTDPEYQKFKSIENLGNYLACNYDDLEEAYDILVKAQEDGFGDEFAFNYVDVWAEVENISVNMILESI